MPHADRPTLDLSELEALYSAAALAHLLQGVRQHLAQDRLALTALLAAPSRADCQSTLHRLKSLLLFIVGESLRERFEAMEAALLQDDRVVLAGAWDQLQQSLTQLDTALAAWLEATGASADADADADAKQQ